MEFSIWRFLTLSFPLAVSGYFFQGFNLDIHDLMKDSLDKQDKSKTVDIFQVMADAIQKEIFHSNFQSF